MRENVSVCDKESERVENSVCEKKYVCMRKSVCVQERGGDCLCV